MVPVVATTPHVEGVTAPLPIQHATVPQHDVYRFEQAMSEYVRADFGRDGIVEAGIAAIEEQETALHKEMSRISFADAESVSSRSLLTLQSKSLQMHFVYEATARVISLATQDINELMRTQ